ncbi:MAG: radical SAM protein [Alphaproteobacteria bacterium]|nr:radical SAM protein [Alphaproteobacteria bacterium]
MVETRATSAPGEAARSSLILTVTRACNLRCSYCPTAKDGWPSLSVAQGLRALELFCERGGGDIKLFGGEPLLAPEVVRAVVREADEQPRIRRIYLSTNGLGLDASWLVLVQQTPKLILTLSMDGRPEDHRRHRRALEGVPDTYEHVMSLLPALLRTPRLVLTQTIPPASAGRAAENLQHLIDLGFRRFNLLPGYYLPWRPAQLAELRRGFAEIADIYRRTWAQGEYLYLRNLFTWAPTPFFNTGMVVDADGSIHPSNLGLSGKLDHLREQTRAGTLEAPPSPEALAAKAEEVNGLLRSELPERIWASTQAVDAELSALCRSLYPAWAAWRRQRRAHAEVA